MFTIATVRAVHSLALRLVRARGEAGGGDGVTFSSSPGESQTSVGQSVSSAVRYYSSTGTRVCKYSHKKSQNAEHRSHLLRTTVHIILVGEGGKREGVGTFFRTRRSKKKTQPEGGGRGLPPSLPPFLPRALRATGGGSGSQRVGVVGAVGVMPSVLSRPPLVSP